MAAGDFLSMNRINVRLATMFPGANSAQTELIEPAFSAQALLQSQTTKVDPILEGSKCVGVKAYFIRTSGQATGIVATSTTCATPCGVEAQTIDKSYDSEILAHDAAFVEDGRCASETGFEEEMAATMARLMASMRKQVNELVLTRVEANVQVNLDDNIPSTWDDTTDTPIIDVPASEFDKDNVATTFAEMQVTAENNDLPDYLILSGRSLSVLRTVEGWNNLNQDGKQNTAAFNSFGSLFFDSRDLDRVIGRKATFAVAKNAYVFWNTKYDGLSTSPKLTDSTTGTYEWMVADPILRYKHNGALVPVMYMVETTRTCIERTPLNEKRYKTCIYMRLIGGFDTIPDGPDGETGILEFDAK